MAADSAEIVQHGEGWILVPLVTGKPRDFLSAAHYPPGTDLHDIFDDALRFLALPAGRVHVRRSI